MDDSSKIQKIQRAYIFTPVLVPADSATPAGDMEAAVHRVAESWNRLIPGKRIRVMTQTRFREACNTLQKLDETAVCQAIEAYSRSSWNRDKRAWKRFENWIEIDVVVPWYEIACANAERRQEAPAFPRLAAVPTAREARAAAPRLRACGIPDDPILADRQRRIARIRAMPAAEREDLLGRARLTVAQGNRGNLAIILMAAAELLRVEETA